MPCLTLFIMTCMRQLLNITLLCQQKPCHSSTSLVLFHKAITPTQLIHLITRSPLMGLEGPEHLVNLSSVVVVVVMDLGFCLLLCVMLLYLLIVILTTAPVAMCRCSWHWLSLERWLVVGLFKKKIFFTLFFELCFKLQKNTKKICKDTLRYV